MSSKRKKLSRDEIDEIVIAQADDMTRWEEPIKVKPRRAGALFLEPELVEKAKTLAKRYRVQSYRTWLKKVLRERIQLEEKKRVHSVKA